MILSVSVPEALVRGVASCAPKLATDETTPATAAIWPSVPMPPMTVPKPAGANAPAVAAVRATTAATTATVFKTFAILPPSSATRRRF